MQILYETFTKRLFSPPALLANAHLYLINSALPPGWKQKSLFLHTASMLCKAIYMFRKVTVTALTLLLVAPALAVDIAPRISDAEIIESLAEIKANQASLDQRLSDFQRYSEQRWNQADKLNLERFAAMQASIDQRFAAIDQRFADMQTNIDQRFAAVDQRFAAVDQRFAAVDQRLEALEKMLYFIGTLIVTLIVGVFGLIGFIIWDRRSFVVPFEHRLQQVEYQLAESNKPKGRRTAKSKLLTIPESIRELARRDPEVEKFIGAYSTSTS